MTRIIITTGSVRKKHRVGDKKLIKGVMHVYRLKHAYFNGKRIGLDCTGGRQRYEWAPIIEEGD